MGHFLSNSLRQSTNRETAEGRRRRAFSYWLFLVFAGSEDFCGKKKHLCSLLSAPSPPSIHSSKCRCPPTVICGHIPPFTMVTIAPSQAFAEAVLLKKISLGDVCLSSNASRHTSQCDVSTCAFLRCSPKPRGPRRQSPPL